MSENEGPQQVPVGPPAGAAAAGDAKSTTAMGRAAADASGTDAAATYAPDGAAEAHARRDTGFFGQPFDLVHIFFVEMWERFSFAPQAFHTQMVALFFLSVALGTAIAGWLAQFYSPDNEVPYFAVLGAIAIVLGIALLLAVKPVLGLMRGVR